MACDTIINNLNFKAHVKADRPKSVRNSCVIERICSVFVSFHFALSVV